MKNNVRKNNAEAKKKPRLWGGGGGGGFRGELFTRGGQKEYCPQQKKGAEKQ